MKKYLAAALCLLLTATYASAQRLELQPFGGLGMTHTFNNPQSDDSKPIAGYGAGLGIAIQLNSVQLSTGVMYLSTGYALEGTFVINEPPGNPLGRADGTLHLRFSHVGVPVLVGNRFRLTKRLMIVPSIGVMPAYNAGARSRFTSPSYTVGQRLTDEEFDQTYRRFSLFGVVQARVQYRMARRVQLFGGPAFRTMFTSLRKPQNRGTLQEQEFALTFDAGLSFVLK